MKQRMTRQAAQTRQAARVAQNLARPLPYKYYRGRSDRDNATEQDEMKERVSDKQRRRDKQRVLRKFGKAATIQVLP